MRQLQSPKEEHWIPLADLMTGMMMLFMLIAVAFMLQVQEQSKAAEKTAESAKALAADLELSKKRIERVATLYETTKEELYRRLRHEFDRDLPRWQAHLEPDLTIRFDNQQVMFATGSADIKPEFAEILADFFSRYVLILGSKEFRDLIEEIRIEGHTSTLWIGQKNEDDAYFKNMKLSQDRTRATLQFLFGLPGVSSNKKWITAKLTANGLSSSRPRLNDNGTENQIGSQRVEFRVRTSSEARLSEIVREFSK